MKASIEISKGSLGHQGMCVVRSEYLQAVPERAICEAVRVKPKLHQRPQDVGDASYVDHLLRRESHRQ
jgi:hypothetical protein